MPSLPPLSPEAMRLLVLGGIVGAMALVFLLVALLAPLLP